MMHISDSTNNIPYFSRYIFLSFSGNYQVGTQPLVQEKQTFFILEYSKSSIPSVWIEIYF